MPLESCRGDRRPSEEAQKRRRLLCAPYLERRPSAQPSTLPISAQPMTVPQRPALSALSGKSSLCPYRSSICRDGSMRVALHRCSPQLISVSLTDVGPGENIPRRPWSAWAFYRYISMMQEYMMRPSARMLLLLSAGLFRNSQVLDCG